MGFYGSHGHGVFYEIQGHITCLHMTLAVGGTLNTNTTATRPQWFFMSHHAKIDPISLLAMVIVTNWFLNKLYTLHHV